MVYQMYPNTFHDQITISSSVEPEIDRQIESQTLTPTQQWVMEALNCVEAPFVLGGGGRGSH